MAAGPKARRRLLKLRTEHPAHGSEDQSLASKQTHRNRRHGIHFISFALCPCLDVELFPGRLFKYTKTHLGKADVAQAGTGVSSFVVSFGLNTPDVSSLS